MLTLKRLADAAVITTLVGLALAPLVPVFTLAAVLVPATGGLALGAAVAGACAWRELPWLKTVAVALGAYLVLGPALATPDLAAGRLWPTWEAEHWLAAGATAIWQRLATVPVPVGRGGGFGLAPFLLAYAGTAAGVSLAIRPPRRRAPWAALAPLPVLAASLVLGTRDTVLALPLGLVIGLGSLAWAAGRSGTLQTRRLVAAGLTVAVGSVGGIGAAALVDGRDRLVVREQVTPPFDPRDYPSPLSAYRRYLKADLKSKVLLKVWDLPPGGVVKLAVMDRFDGVVWNVDGGFGRLADARAETPATAVRLESHDSQTVWLYSVGAPVAATFGVDRLREAVRFNPATGTMALPPQPPDGLGYTLETVWSTYRPPDGVIAAADSGTAVLPAGARVQSAELRAASVTLDAATAGAKALALEKHLQDGYYSDGQEGPGEGAGRHETLAGHGADRIAALLDADLMVGDAEQYASAMAVMARSLGLPARLVMGYAPGYGEQAAADHRGSQGAGTEGGAHTFKGVDMTAWVEVDLKGLGWVAFFPTPNRQDSPMDAEERPDPQPRPRQAQPPPQAPRASEPPDEELEPVPVGSAKPVPSPPMPRGPLSIAAAAVGAAVLVLAAGATAVVVAKALRRRRRRGAGSPGRRIVAGWQEVVDQLRDLRLVGRSPPTATRSEIALAAPAEARPLLRRLARESDAAAFGGAPASDEQAARYWAGVTRAEQVLTRGIGPWKRLRAKLSLRSLRRSEGSGQGHP
ncbi:MAG: DUF3488 and transglutaminase-like domain-containing protein [Bifidobacteriaceae bacterium]|jgi:transglutaminase-like putative cysteine protease|nr:DUF3488 and transglutaminase-like domain-containing protein [Bifidobacteriaceae bacterium]